VCKLGFGEHLWNLEDDRLLPILRYCMSSIFASRTLTYLFTVYIARSLYIAILGLIKASLILFYLEIFTTRRFKTIGWVVFGYIVVNSLVMFLLTSLPCTPVSAFWNRDLTLGTGRCMDIQIIGYANSVSVIVQDIILLVLPIFFIKNVKMKRFRRVVVASMFSIGSL
jgi:hypothetical protein